MRRQPRRWQFPLPRPGFQSGDSGNFAPDGATAVLGTGAGQIDRAGRVLIAVMFASGLARLVTSAWSGRSARTRQGIEILGSMFAH